MSAEKEALPTRKPADTSGKAWTPPKFRTLRTSEAELGLRSQQDAEGFS